MSKDKPIATPSLTTISLHPEIQGTPIHFIDEWITPVDLFFLRNHFEYPPITPASYALTFDGLVKKPGMFQYQQLMQMPSKTIVLPLECSGNKRDEFNPPTFGTQWNNGAISQGAWTGVPLRDILGRFDVEDTACDVVFEGHDSGKIEGLDGVYPFARSIPIEVAMHPDTLIAYGLNGRPIPYKHGYPFRLIVPKWYAMASVKWLKRATLLDKPFDGPYQDPDYHYFPYEDSDQGKEPVTLMKVNSIIQQPLPQSTLDVGEHRIYGIAWTGEGIIDKVEISFDCGVNWQETELRQDPDQPYSWTFWSYNWHADKTGKYTIMARATDSTGKVQPRRVEWNRLGYGYNGIPVLNVQVV